MFSDDHLEGITNSNAQPIDQIYFQEFVSGVHKAGSLISMIENKKLNAAGLFCLILENLDYQRFFVEATSSENLRDAILSMLYLYPALVKSKITKAAIRKFNAKQNNRTRKTTVQQTFGGIKNIKKQTVQTKAKL